MIIDIFLALAYMANCFLTAWVFGACIGKTIGKIVTCASGYSMREVDEVAGTVITYHYTFLGAWNVMGMIDDIRQDSYYRHTLKPE